MTAAGQTIGIIELGGGFRRADITAYFKSLGQKPPTVIAVPVGTGKNNPTTADSADGEVMLDIEVASPLRLALVSSSISRPIRTKDLSTLSPTLFTTRLTNPA